MKILHNRTTVLALVLATSLYSPSVWAQSAYSDYLPQIYQQGDVSFLSGGIGENETEALREVKEQYNLRVTSADKNGEYRGDTRIIISDAQSR